MPPLCCPATVTSTAASTPYAKQAFSPPPPLVVAYAIAGTVRFDIERDALARMVDGRPITLKDLWPSDEEIDAIAAKASSRSSSARCTSRCSIRGDDAEKSEAAVRLARTSTYIAARRIGKARAGRRAHLERHAAAWPSCRTTSPPTTSRRPTPF